MNQLATTGESQLSISAPMDGAAMLEMISRAAQDPSVDVDKMERLLGMAERMQARQDARGFAAALAALQGETIRVSATKAVDQKADGTCRYRFAPYEEIMAQVQPLLSRHGFSITFDTEVGEARLTCICTLTHSSGEARQNRFAVRYGKPPGSSDAQGDMSTKSYAKRGALCDALNIVIDHDDDARTAGAYISAEKAAELESRCVSTKANRSKFLEFAGAATFAEIGEGKLPELERMLAKKERETQPKEEQDANGDFKF